uniref:Bestrophin homolog n=1 Tax=Leptocylindrus danicus TaxID=163516 RepID=A0A7S2LR46_9STRA|mmetsp:Transcript_8210/g.12206  ORF Transcript_8210/g.12206 Transcript_8210/m.12206 type:complete len:325 (+) Transcript_8210:58-1032(+)|eukprot:CAMPEP_0116016064 /NCGR_PEP_ID=MMETSP0321-20121206/7239_1 /TAXON_ID=163516 /ORGANISM="Leptocylindrus danicus var. danicus, Strain B650" /LENGTH=324 /DNA_ID=CAMNT_0003486013 /DNA_START=16 /DNA_END=990 /DNA_ORIENTATION=+
MTILYDSKNTIQIILRRKGSVWKQVVPFCLLTVGISIGIYYFENTYGHDSENDENNLHITFDDAGHKMLATMVAYLVVSRVNAAYCRFWEARTLLSHALFSARQFSVNTVIFTNQDLSERANEWRFEMRQGILELLSASLDALQDEDFHKDRKLKYLESTDTRKGYTASITQISHQLQDMIVQQKDYLEKPMLIQKELKLHESISDFMTDINELAKISATPYPFPTTQMTRILLFVWMFTLPFALVNNAEDQYSTPILMFFITYGFFGLEFVAIELDDPFGTDPNDLEMSKLSTQIIDGINRDITDEGSISDYVISFLGGVSGK